MILSSSSSSWSTGSWAMERQTPWREERRQSRETRTLCHRFFFRVVFCQEQEQCFDPFFKSQCLKAAFQEFVVKYLGKKEARGLWGIKHTRKPVDDMVGLARGLQPGTPLPYLQLSVSERGVQVGAHKRNVNPSFEPGLHPIDTISYGVQDLVYTRWSCVDMASIEKHALAEFLR